MSKEKKVDSGSVSQNIGKPRVSRRFVNKKMNELYVSKRLTLVVPYRGKTREIQYMITGVFGTEMQMTAALKSIKYPCEIPKMQMIEIRLNNEFPTKKLIKEIQKFKK
jgi:hypothetical protein